MKQDKMIRLVNEATQIKNNIDEFGTDAYNHLKLYKFIMNYPEMFTLISSYLRTVADEDVEDLSINTTIGDIIISDDWKVLFATIDKIVADKPIQYDRIWEQYGYVDTLQEV